jgi:peptidoglycan/LPS O-acetylase OafA/YrhL
MNGRRMRLVVLMALVCGAGVIALVVTSDHQDAQAIWGFFGPAVGWSFVGTGLYAWRRRPESRTGELMVLLGFAWFVSALHFADAALPFSISLVAGACGAGCSCSS